MSLVMRIAGAVLLFMIAAAELSAAVSLLPPAGAQTSDDVKVKLVADCEFIRPAVPFKIGVELEMLPGWHTYYKEPGDAGMPTRIEWLLPEGFEVGPLIWSKPEKFEETGLVTYGYKDRTIIGAEVKPPADLAPDTDVDLKAHVKWLACKDICVPGQADVSLKLPVKSATSADAPANAELFAMLDEDKYAGGHPENILDKKFTIEGAGTEKHSLTMYLFLAFVGGFILNFMPCVLPVISLKVLSFMEQAGEDPGRVFRLGLAFSGGILVSTAVLAGIVIGIQSAGQKVGWGFQFQNPAFVIAMSVIVLVLALSMFGLFYIQVSVGQSELDRLASKEGFAGTFFKGVLATVLATPCSAPFLGTAIGFAFTQPSWIIGSVFMMVGLGMASPYIVLTANPAWMRYIPRPGAWMERFKEAMGFLLLATVVWLLFILGNQLGIRAVTYTSAFLVCVSFACWLVGRMMDLTSSLARKTVVWSCAAIVVGLGVFIFIRPIPGITGEVTPGSTGSVQPVAFEEEIEWVPFTADELNEHLSSGKTVFLDFTADWCLTCKANENAVINTKPVKGKFEELDVVTMKADWTRQNPEITELLKKFGRSGVPLYVIFPGDRPTAPIVLPEIISQSMVLENLNKAGPSKR